MPFYNMLPYVRIEHGEFFRNRASERELCQDFPGDKILIDGLHSMQVHLWSNGRNIDIPVVKVMNAAHYLAAYMFRTTCSGDQTEYDTLAYCSVGHDKRLMLIAIIVLAAMLQRTKGLRAGQCRDILIENRNEDFEEGVTLYERFLRSAEKRFAEEDFLTDIPAVIEQMKEKDEIIYQQAQQIQQLQYTINTMKEKSNNTQIIGTQYKQDNNQGTIYNAPVTIQYITNPGEQNISEPKQAYSEKEEPAYTPPIPREGDYNGVRLYIEERKKYDEQFKDFCLNHNRKELCTFLTKEFGWFVDDKSLGRNIQRNI